MFYTELTTVVVLASATAATLLSCGVLPLPIASQQLSYLSNELNVTACLLLISAEVSRQEVLAFQARLFESKSRRDDLQSLIQDDSDDTKRAHVACQVGHLILSKVTASSDLDYEIEKNANWYVAIHLNILALIHEIRLAGHKPVG
jgi:hypothetical protein